MPKFTLIAEHTNWYTNKVESKVTYEFEADGITDVLQNTDLFLRGVGYSPEGTLDYVSDEFTDDYQLDPDWDNLYTEEELVDHDKSYFDTERNK